MMTCGRKITPQNAMVDLTPPLPSTPSLKSQVSQRVLSKIVANVHYNPIRCRTLIRRATIILLFLPHLSSKLKQFLGSEVAGISASVM